ncbi:hypothetical protein DS745_22545 [Anaerobacillus alkaliphilus]|uniref:Zf-HC2 domain-containing protein n=1 Tax=Anaerobacillus alkaliphilus TaxID=1548597 RepID=A0A4Q0VNS1_9BACI|nr:hypothetical protein [Anaerobacillus alkaliphilus]RXI96492.1 hypothetical protein DS745_22545 [Anaerobacillus alkaliphilus]
MNNQDDCAVFQNLYELYMENEVEEETRYWMEEHKSNCQFCLNYRTDTKPLTANQDGEKIWGIRILTMTMYGFFIVLSVWMSIWYFW